MTERGQIRRPRVGLFVAFFIADILLLCVGIWIWWQGHRPLLPYEIAGMGLCIGLAGWFGAWPFVIRERSWYRVYETEQLLGAVETLRSLKEVARLVEQATDSWQLAHDYANQVAQRAEELARHMDQERQRFIEFLKEAQATEMAHLQLEVEKLRRSQHEWLQITVFILDHVHALFVAAIRSGKEEVIKQIAKFRSVVIDAVRRLGIAVILPCEGEPFSSDYHAVPDGVSVPEKEPVVAQVLAPGYRFQGRLLRPALVVPVSRAATCNAGNTPAEDKPRLESKDQPEGQIVEELCEAAPVKDMSKNSRDKTPYEDPFTQTEPITQSFADLPVISSDVPSMSDTSAHQEHNGHVEGESNKSDQPS